MLTSTPSPSAMARRTMAACSPRMPAYRSPSSWISLVEPSMSVNRNVTVPVGSFAMWTRNVARSTLGGPMLARP